MIKVTLGEKPQQESKPFPKLMTTKKGGVFYWLNNTTMVCLQPDSGFNPWKFGEYDNDVDIRYFTDYNKPITIQNA